MWEFLRFLVHILLSPDAISSRFCKIKHREGMDKAVSMPHSAMQPNCTSGNRSAWAKGWGRSHRKSKRRRNLAHTVEFTAELLRGWMLMTVSQMRNKAEMSSSRVVGGIVSILSHSTFILKPNDDSWGWGGRFCLKHLLKEPDNLINTWRIPGQVCLIVLKPASVNTLGSMPSAVAAFSPGKFSRHT